MERTTETGTTNYKGGSTMKKRRGMRHVAIGIAAAVLISLVAANARAEDRSCVLHVSPLSVSVDNERAARLTVVASDPECSFDVQSDAEWISVTPASVKGSGIVDLGIIPSIEPRTGTIKIGGNEVTVFQKGLIGTYGNRR